MASIQFAAPIIRTAISALQTGLPAQVAAFNADAANQVQLAVPATFHFGGSDILANYAFPQVEVAIVEGRSRDWAVGNVEFDHDLRANVAVWHEGDTGEIPTIYEQALGLGRCAIEVLSVPHAFGAGVDIANAPAAVFWRVDVVPADPTVPNREFQRWRTPILVQFALETVERFV